MDDVAGAHTLAVDDQGAVLGDVLRHALEDTPRQLDSHAAAESVGELAPPLNDRPGRR
jgi:hypothetical protein